MMRMSLNIRKTLGKKRNMNHTLGYVIFFLHASPIIAMDREQKSGKVHILHSLVSSFPEITVVTVCNRKIHLSVSYARLI